MLILLKLGTWLFKGYYFIKSSPHSCLNEGSCRKMPLITPEVFWFYISERERTLKWYLLLPPMAENYCSVKYTERKSILTARYNLKKLLVKTVFILLY